MNTAELSTVELGVGIFSACLPAYRPLFNLCFHGEVTHSGAKGRSKAYIKSSSERRAIRMADIRRGWYGNGEALGSGDEEQIHTAFVTAPNAQGDKNFRQHSESDNRILVTREFDTESFSAR